jgi:Uma2 family endonuclease
MGGTGRPGAAAADGLRKAGAAAMMGARRTTRREGGAMSRITRPPVAEDLDYPTSDGRPMAETDWHRKLMNALIDTLAAFFLAAPRVYVSGNLLVFYERGNKRKHLAPDVFVVRGVAKKDRLHYLIWREGKPPDLVIELTSSSTRQEDVEKKYALYRDVLKVKEYFLFDPFEDYLDPPMQGYRLRQGQYVPIKPVAGRLPSRVVGLHLERDGIALRLWDPVTEQWLLTPEEARRQAVEAARQAQAAAREALETARQAEENLAELEAENERLRRELERLRRRPRKP